ncbi:collagen alpha-4(IV) chain-like [Cuculus canorus]|uniref:collagen alpha-4(IV) chain-like n=1 Tax=Cuculus canorus TaxID=55661 RepID=UPI0023AAB05E|nr:collagen alpha-4(IV) chain-like [Cuculus canorus]
MAALRVRKERSSSSVEPRPLQHPPAPDPVAAPGVAAGPCAAHEQPEQIAICPPPPREMKGGTGMTNPKLSTFLLVFRHEPRLQPVQTAHGWLRRQPAPATQRHVSPPRKGFESRLCPTSQHSSGLTGTNQAGEAASDPSTLLGRARGAADEPPATPAAESGRWVVAEDAAYAGQPEQDQEQTPQALCPPGCGCQPRANAPGTAPAPRQLAGRCFAHGSPPARWQADARLPGVGAGKCYAAWESTLQTRRKAKGRDGSAKGLRRGLLGTIGPPAPPVTGAAQPGHPVPPGSPRFYPSQAHGFPRFFPVLPSPGTRWFPVPPGAAQPEHLVPPGSSRCCPARTLGSSPVLPGAAPPGHRALPGSSRCCPARALGSPPGSSRCCPARAPGSSRFFPVLPRPSTRLAPVLPGAAPPGHSALPRFPPCPARPRRCSSRSPGSSRSLAAPPTLDRRFLPVPPLSPAPPPPARSLPPAPLLPEQKAISAPRAPRPARAPPPPRSRVADWSARTPVSPRGSPSPAPAGRVYPLAIGGGAATPPPDGR